MSSAATTVLAKTTRPEIGNVLPRERLFQQLDGGASRKAAWLSGPAGTGKSTLAASYLQARDFRWAWYQIDRDDDDVASFFYYLTHAARHLRVPEDALPRYDAGQVGDLASFVRTYFRTLFAKAGPGTALVFDDLHVLAPDSGLHAVLEVGLLQVPPGCCVVVTSREGPPVACSRMRANGELVWVKGDALRVTEDELAGIAHLRGGMPLAAGELRAMQVRAQGWAAGLVLMLEYAKVADPTEGPPDDATPDVVFDYFAGEIFDRFEPETRRFLLSIACLPRMTAQVARELSGEAGAGRLLRNLVLNDYFVRELVGGGSHVFQLHPLLRQFLLRRAASDLPEAIGDDARRKGATLLHAAGLVEDAVELYAECHDWAGLAAIATEQGATLLASGRRTTLAAWLELLPPGLLDADPALSCAYAESRMYASPRAARHDFEQAFAKAAPQADAYLVLRACAGVVATTILEFDDLAPLDRWTVELLRFSDTCTEDDMAVLAQALLLRDPQHPALAAWIAAALPAIRGGNGGRHEALVHVANALVHGEHAGEGVASIAPDRGVPETHWTKAGIALLRLLDGEHAQALQLARDGIAALGEEIAGGHAIWLRMLAAASLLEAGTPDEARIELDAIDQTALRRGDRAFLCHLRGAIARAQGNASQAMREMKGAQLLAIETGLPWVEALARLALVQLQADSGDLPSARVQLRNAWAVIERLDSPHLRIAAELTEAAIHLAAGEEVAASTAMAHGLGRVRSLDLRHVPGIDRDQLAVVCAAAMRSGVEAESARTLVRTGQLSLPAAAQHMKQWPWRFRIETLGGFALLRGTAPIAFSAKGAGRPIELLKLMVALGGVGIRAEQLAETLWPHVDADYAYKSFTATLHRLRRILDDDNAVLLRDGRLSLNRGLVWLDAWALDEVIAEMEAKLRIPGEAQFDAGTALVEEALALYRGAFLPDEDDQPAFAAKREQVRARLARSIARFARTWEDAGVGESVVDCYVRLTDADELCEAFHRQLMGIHQRQGDTAGAVGVYDRLCGVLAARLKAPPSPETQAVFATLRS